jgi:hypothetical protein
MQKPTSGAGEASATNRRKNKMKVVKGIVMAFGLLFMGMIGISMLAAFGAAAAKQQKQTTRVGYTASGVTATPTPSVALPEVRRAFRAPTPTPAPEPEAADKLEVVKKRWHKGGFGAVSIWHVTFRNKGDKPIGNIRYRTFYRAETGEIVDQGGVEGLLDYTVKKVIKPGQTRTIEINDGFINGQEISTAKFEVVSAEYIHFVEEK